VKSEDKKTYQVDIPLKIDTAAVIKRMQIRNGNPRMEKMALELIDIALGVARPKAIYRISQAKVIDRGTVDIDGIQFTSRALSKCLKDQPTVYPLLATAGQELDELPTVKGDLMRQFTLDTIKMVILFSASEYLTNYIKEKHSLNGAAALNPGEFDDFPLSQQKPLFALFGGAEKQIGVALTSGGALKPTKSRSGILFPNETGFMSCKLCTMLKCPGRRAAYNPEVFKEYIGTP
jgi:hypothetical protein